MKDENKTKKQLLAELTEMRHRITILEELEARRKRTEEALRESEARYRSLFENTGTATFVTEEDMTISEVNKRAVELSGYEEQELSNRMKTTDFVAQEHLEMIRKYHLSRRKEIDESPDEYEFNQVDGHGKVKNVLIQVGMIPGTKESIASIIDITPLKQTQEELRESEGRFRTLFQNAPIGIGLATLDGHILDGNDAITEIFGYSKKELEEINLRDVYLDPKERSLMFESYRAQGCIRNYEVKLKHKDGAPFDASVTVIPFTHCGEDVHLTVIEDIRDRKRAEEEREQLITELRAALSKVKTLSGMLPICATCKKIRDDKGYWRQVESYIRDHSDVRFSHGICPECIKELYPDYGKNRL
jgi:PAS domain S-box-containing protein